MPKPLLIVLCLSLAAPALAQAPARGRGGRITTPGRADVPPELAGYVARFTGTTREDCGLHGLRGREFDRVMATEGELRDSVQCAMKAAGAHTPFWMLYQVPGSDSWLGVGLFGTSAGEIFRFSFDGSPCGNDDCPGRLSLERCPAPSIERRLEIGPPEIRCTTDR